MSTTRRASRQLARNRSRGQSIPLIALILVIVVAMVGLSVDVGNTFSQERKAVLAADSASLSAMQEVMKRSTSNNQKVYDVIEKSLIANGMNLAVANTPREPGQVSWQAFYLDRKGESISQMPVLRREASAIPNDVAYVKVVLDGEVGTYFARVVGRPDLPIAAKAYAGMCPVSAGVYPIGINTVLVNKLNGTFNNPGPGTGSHAFDWNYSVITNPLSPYVNKTKMRIPLHFRHPGTTGAGGNFGMLNWTNDNNAGNAGATSERLWFPGNLEKGYQEVPASEVQGLPNFVPGWEPNGKLDIGDWIRGDNGLAVGGNSTNGIKAPILDHIDRGTQMILPIYDSNVDGSGSNAKFKIVDLGLFVITDFDSNPSSGYIEMIYLGDPTPNRSVCNTTIPPTPDTPLELRGNVSFWPQYQLSGNNPIPVRYVVVMDVSGSMAATFDGRCDFRAQTVWDTPAGRDGTTEALSPPVQCTAATNNDGLSLQLSDVLQDGYRYRWSNVNERRLAIAREAVKALIKSANMPGNTRSVPGSVPDQIAFLTFGNGAGWERVARFNSDGSYKAAISYDPGSDTFSSNPAGLTAAVDGLMNDNVIKDGQGTNGTAGLYQASLILRSVPTSSSVKFKNVVIMITDGITNIQFHPSAYDSYFGRYSRRLSDANGKAYVNPNEYPANHDCVKGPPPQRLDRTNAYRNENAACQQNDAGWKGGTTPKTLNDNPSTSATLSRPLTQLAEASQKYLKNATDSQGNPLAEVFVVGLSGASRAGMAGVVSRNVDSNFFLVNQAQLLDDTLQKIYENTSDAVCKPGQDVETKQILAGQLPIGTEGITNDTAGYVSLTGITTKGDTISLGPNPITVNPDHTLSYLFKKVPRGQYKLTAYIGYKHPSDVYTSGRLYNLFAGNLREWSVTVPATAPNGEPMSSTQANLVLYLGGEICPATP